jgi:hypothetical protein
MIEEEGGGSETESINAGSVMRLIEGEVRVSQSLGVTMVDVYC